MVPDYDFNNVTFNSFSIDPQFQTTWNMFRLCLLKYQSFEFKLISANLAILTFAVFQSGMMVAMYNYLVTTKAIQIVRPEPFLASDFIKGWFGVGWWKMGSWWRENGK